LFPPDGVILTLIYMHTNHCKITGISNYLFYFRNKGKRRGKEKYLEKCHTGNILEYNIRALCLNPEVLCNNACLHNSSKIRLSFSIVTCSTNNNILEFFLYTSLRTFSVFLLFRSALLHPRHFSYETLSNGPTPTTKIFAMAFININILIFKTT